MSIPVNLFTALWKKAPRKASGNGVETMRKLAECEFDIDTSTNKINKCPGGHIPTYTGISKGQTSAHFPRETCENCELCERCQSKMQAKDFVVRFSLSAIAASRENEGVHESVAVASDRRALVKDRDPSPQRKGSQAPGTSVKSYRRFIDWLRNGRRDGSVSMIRRYGIIAGIAVICLIIGVTALSGDLLRSSDDFLSAAPVEVAETPASTVAEEPTIVESPFPDPVADTESIENITSGDDAAETIAPQTRTAPIPSATALADTGGIIPDSAGDDDLPEPPDAAVTSDEPAQEDAADSGGAVPELVTSVGAGAPVVAGTAPASASQAPATPLPETDPLPYLIYVSKNSFTIAILGLDDDGEYTKLLRTFSTGIGRSSAQTRAGTYTITTRERWRDWGGNTYTPYSTQHSGGLFFHGPVFTAKDPYHLKVSSYNEIGTACSSGCMRTYTSAAAWIYYNCEAGTKVIIANDSMYASSPPARLDESQTFDPTDPDVQAEIPLEIPEPYLAPDLNAIDVQNNDTAGLEVSSADSEGIETRGSGFDSE